MAKVKIDKNKRMIWGNYPGQEDDYLDDWKEAYEEHLEMNGIDKDELSLEEYIEETNNNYLYDERANLNVKVDGVIVVYALLGLWDGIHFGGKTCGNNVRNILSSKCDYVEWFCDRYNVRCNASHHDGNNHYLYRVAKDEETAERIVNRIVDGDMTEEQFRKATKSLRPYVARVYGF